MTSSILSGRTIDIMGRPHDLTRVGERATEEWEPKTGITLHGLQTSQSTASNEWLKAFYDRRLMKLLQILNTVVTPQQFEAAVPAAVTEASASQPRPSPNPACTIGPFHMIPRRLPTLLVRR